MVAEDHKLLAPTLLRSQVLSMLFEAVQRGELDAATGLERLGRIGRMSIRYLGDGVLRRRAWDLANRLGWASTYDAGVRRPDPVARRRPRNPRPRARQGRERSRPRGDDRGAVEGLTTLPEPGTVPADTGRGGRRMPYELTGLEGKVAVVTGAGRMRSIGRSIAVELARAGCDVVLTGTGRSPDRYPPDEQEAGWRDIDVGGGRDRSPWPPRAARGLRRLRPRARRAPA